MTQCQDNLRASSSTQHDEHGDLTIDSSHCIRSHSVNKHKERIEVFKNLRNQLN
jgi:hypothetical protein